MLTMVRFRMSLAVIFALCLASLPVFAAPPTGGGGSKVSVTAANPSDAFQGEELDIIVSGSGFDNGSQVSYLVTGTTDASQVEVLSVQFISSTELKTRIRPKDAALPTVYDIEVRTLSGRKGKGTTLFRVKVAENACTGNEAKEPEIAYLTALNTTGEVHTQDIYLSSGSGCDQYLLFEGAVQVRPNTGSDPKNGQGEILADVLGLRLDVNDSEGIVVWRESSLLPSPLLAVRFMVLSDGSILADSSAPELAYLPPDGYSVYFSDVRLNDSNEVEVVVVERDVLTEESRLVYVKVDSAERVVLNEGNCDIQDASGNCLILRYTRPWWNEDGSLIYFDPHTVAEASASVIALARLERNELGWNPAQVLMTTDNAVNVLGIRADGLLAYEWLHYTRQKNGRRTDYNDTYWVTATIDPELCVAFECNTTDGQEMTADPNAYPRGWTRDGGMLFIQQVASGIHIRAYSDPQLGIVGTLDISNVDRDERDTSY